MTDIQMMNNLDVDGKIKASGDVEDGEGTTLASLKAGKVGDVKIDGQSVVTLGIAEIPPAEEEVVGAAMCGFDGYIESPYWRHATSTVEYVGLYVPYEYTHELVTSENKDTLGIVPGTTPAFFVRPNTYQVLQTPPRWDEFYGYTEFEETGAYMGFYVEYNGQMVKVVEENKDSLGIVPGTTKAYNRAGGLFAEITVDQMVEYDSENPVSSKAVKTALLNYLTISGAQTITGAKTFVGAFTVQSGVSSVITMKNTVFDKNAVNSSYKLPFQINGSDANNNAYVSLNYEARASDIRVVTLIGKSETKEAALQLFANESAQWAQVPYRTYASANVNDVVTIGSLASNPSVIHTTGNETKAGNLTLTNLLYVKNGSVDVKTAPTAYQSLKDIITTQDKEGEMIMRLRRDRDVSYERVLFTNRYYDRTAQVWNTCELLLQAVGNTAELILKKTVSGTSTQTTVATL